MTGPGGRGSAAHVSVDPIRCDAHGMCAEVLPERVTLDDWGYPIVDGRALEPDLISHAKLAVATCPVLAIKLAGRA
jgi:ferredoxin